MNRMCRVSFGLAVGMMCAAQGIKSQDHPPRVEETKSRPAGAARVTAAPMMLFGAIPVATRSVQARKFAEVAMDKYENVMLDDAVVQAQHAVEKDPNFALGYALIAFTKRRTVPDPAALARAKQLLPLATPDEQLMVHWMTSVQDRNLLPAISSMNDLLKRYPKNKHVLYLTSEWLFLQEDFDRSQKMMEFLLQLDPNFPPVLNMLGYSYIQSGHPDPVKAIALIKHYIQAEPGSPNPEDSMGEVLRYAGDFEGSLQHYGTALQIDPTFYSSQLGLGDTLTLMGHYDEARAEYGKAALLAENERDLLHAVYQKALTYFWEGHPEQGRTALATLAAEADSKKEPNAQFEIALALAMLTPDSSSELRQLAALEQQLQLSSSGMTEAERGSNAANVLCEEARIASQHGLREVAQQAVDKLAQLANQSGDLLVANHYDTARGYLLFAAGDLANATDELSADRLSPLALQQLANAQQKAGDSAAAAESLTELKYERAPTVEWYLISQSGAVSQ
jgi:tetratricopeptide (TPR) repeat protein